MNKPREEINPKHYQFKVNGQVFETVDLMEAMFPNDMHLSQALKYFMRAGRKPTSTYMTDLSKCLWWICRALMFHGVKSIELPPNAPVKGQPTTTRKKASK